MSEPDPAKNVKLDRRALLLGAIFLAGGAAALLRHAREPRSQRTAAAVFTPGQFALLEQVTDVIIPPTETPGALAAGVPAFLRGLLDTWASEATRAQIRGVLDAIEQRAWESGGAGFVDLPAERRLALMRRYDESCVAMQDVAYGRFKQLVLLGYYQSEIGATRELRYELVPGAWHGCLPLSEAGRTSAT